MLRFLTAGESHGPSLTAILEGMPAGLELAVADVNQDMRRRQKSRGAGGRMKIEKDQVRFTAGVMAGRTTGSPIGMQVENRDWANWAEKDIPPMTIPRPGHADWSAAVKYGYGDLRLALERASARETAARVAVGAVCRRLLEMFGIVVGSYVLSIGSESVELALPEGKQEAVNLEYQRRFKVAEICDVRCPDPAAAERFQAFIDRAVDAKDTVGGVFEIVALGLPPGLGTHVHWDRRLDSRLLGAVGGVQAVKGVEIGPAFENSRLPGTDVHDEFLLSTEEDDGEKSIWRRTNRAGGLEGGITTGQPLILRGAMKPIATTLTPLRSVDLASGEPAHTQYERSDFCAVPRAAVVAEAMVGFVLADALVNKLGGDSLEEMQARFERLRRGRLDELPMNGEPWRFGYE